MNIRLVKESYRVNEQELPCFAYQIPLLSQVEVFVAHHLLSSSSSNHHFRCHFPCLLRKSENILMIILNEKSYCAKISRKNQIFPLQLFRIHIDGQERLHRL